MERKNIKERIKEYFLNNPTEKLRVRQIERKVKVPLPSAIRYTKELVKEGVNCYSFYPKSCPPLSPPTIAGQKLFAIFKRSG